jgi:hypothetical protein
MAEKTPNKKMLTALFDYAGTGALLPRICLLHLLRNHWWIFRNKKLMAESIEFCKVQISDPSCPLHAFAVCCTLSFMYYFTSDPDYVDLSLCALNSLPSTAHVDVNLPHKCIEQLLEFMRNKKKRGLPLSPDTANVLVSCAKKMMDGMCITCWNNKKYDCCGCRNDIANDFQRGRRCNGHHLVRMLQLVANAFPNFAEVLPIPDLLLKMALHVNMTTSSVDDTVLFNARYKFALFLLKTAAMPARLEQRFATHKMFMLCEPEQPKEDVGMDFPYVYTRQRPDLRRVEIYKIRKAVIGFLTHAPLQPPQVLLPWIQQDARAVQQKHVTMTLFILQKCLAYTKRWYGNRSEWCAQCFT